MLIDHSCIDWSTVPLGAVLLVVHADVEDEALQHLVREDLHALGWSSCPF